jgi:hypothetical protein
MILLKVVKTILEYHQSNDHPYSEAFKATIEKIGLTNLRKSYIEQFKLTLDDIQPTKYISGDIFNSPQKLQSWSERKHREMNEILQIILLTIHYEQDKMETCLFVFEFIHDILTNPMDIIKDDPSKKLLRNICVYSQLYLDNASTLLRYIAIGNPGLQNFMENESNWFIAAESDIFWCLMP